MAFDAFLKIDGIDGESQVRGFEKWIELLSFSWGAEILADTGGGGIVSGKVSPKAFSFVKLTDTASPAIFIKMAAGSHFDKVSLACRKASGVPADPLGNSSDAFVKIDFSDVLFSSFSEGGTTATDQRPMESISFAFSKIEFSVAANLPGGGLGDFFTGDFSFLTNRSG